MLVPNYGPKNSPLATDSPFMMARVLVVDDLEPSVRRLEEIALCHHERWHGTGYPRGIAGDAIPLSARIVAIVDAFEELVREQPALSLP